MEPEDFPETFFEKHPNIKKVILLSITIFLLIITITYFLTTPAVRNILAGLVESEKITNQQVKLKSGNYLIFQNNTYQELSQIYEENPELEFKVCLKGVINKDYIITEIFKPKIYRQTHNSVTAEPCPDDSLVSLHSHPLKHCLPSDIDLKNFQRFKGNNPQALMAIMCMKDRFNFYS